MTLLQTTAALNTGNSGGALVNDQGQVIGITNMKLVSTDADSNTLEGLGFAIPTATVKPVVDSLIQSGHVTGRPTLGVTVRGLYPSEKEARGVACGLLVDAVQAGSDAADKGAGGGYPPHRQRHRAEHHRRSAGRPGRLGRGREHPLPGGPGGSLPGVLRPAGGAV
ncbi:MAG: S1C family serine protease [Intestinimonas sp.]